MSHVLKSPLFRWITGGFLAAVAVTAVTVALWPASAEETARADGKQVGQAVSDLYYAQSTDEVDAAMADLDDAVAQSRDHASSEVNDQVNKQVDALDRAADGFVGSRTTDDAFEADLYQSELDYALDDLSSQAGDFRTHGPQVVQAFWDGVDDGLVVQ
jgi:gas vesicle protein